MYFWEFKRRFATVPVYRTIEKTSTLSQYVATIVVLILISVLSSLALFEVLENYIASSYRHLLDAFTDWQIWLAYLVKGAVRINQVSFVAISTEPCINNDTTYHQIKGILDIE